MLLETFLAVNLVGCWYVYSICQNEKPMQQIIYYNEQYGYGVVDVLTNNNLPRKVAELAASDAQIICVFEVETLKASFTCRSYELHLQLIKASYPSTMIGKFCDLFRKGKRPDYTMLSNLERPSSDLSDLTSTWHPLGKKLILN